MSAPYGAMVSIYYDSPREIQEGERLQTTTGRTYLIVELKRQSKGKHVGRWHIKAIVLERPPGGTKAHPTHWYKR